MVTLTNSICAGALQHCLHVICEPGDAVGRSCNLGESNGIAPATDCNHDLGVGEFGTDGRDGDLRSEARSVIGVGEGEDDMVDAFTVGCICWTVGMPSNIHVSEVSHETDRSGLLVIIRNEASGAR